MNLSLQHPCKSFGLAVNAFFHPSAPSLPAPNLKQKEQGCLLTLRKQPSSSAVNEVHHFGGWQMALGEDKLENDQIQGFLGDIKGQALPNFLTHKSNPAGFCSGHWDGKEFGQLNIMTQKKSLLSSRSVTPLSLWLELQLQWINGFSGQVAKLWILKSSTESSSSLLI